MPYSIRIARGLVLGLLTWLALCLSPVLAQTFLPASQAFQLAVRADEAGRVQAEFTMAPAVYLYRERLEAKLDAGGGQAPQVLSWNVPTGIVKYDATFEKDVEVYYGFLPASVVVPEGLQGVHTLTLVYQGCADAGLCYPPQTRHYRVEFDGQGRIREISPLAPGGGGAVAGSGAAGSGASTETGPASGAALNPSDEGGIAAALASGRWSMVVPAFLLAGVLLSLTPCVLPMVPILSSIILGHKGDVGRGRGFALALSYSQGMALVYTGLGVAAGLLGQGLAAYLQHPWVVLGFAALMVLLALSMFGLYELQLPASVQSWLGEGSRGLPGGKFVSVFAMGVVSALIVSPCVSAPLAGALLYIGQTGDVALGGVALYAMAWGMSLPLLLVGLSAGTLLPRAGPWMKAVKLLFGVLMLALAAWVARPAWPYLQTLVGMTPAASSHQSVLPFERVRSVTELNAAVARAASAGKPVMLDFYADWCAACLEMEHDSFRDPQVRAALAGAVLLQADVTLNGPEDRALLARFKLFGPPGIIFFDAQGRELAGATVIGYQAPAAFLASLARAGLQRVPAAK